VTPEKTPESGGLRERVDLAPLKGDARAGYPPHHPYRLAVEALPDHIPADELRAQLRILLPLSRVKEV
jgi:hypothetical protein